MSDTACAFQREAALANLNDDAELLEAMVAAFVELWPEHRETLREACETGDAKTIFSRAHAVKGSAMAIGAMECTELAEKLETMGQEERLDGACAALDRLARAVDRFCRAADAPSPS